MRNYATYTWSRAHVWILRGRFATPQEATTSPYFAGVERLKGCVIDLVSGRQIWRDGKYCDRAKPTGIHSLPPIEVYQENQPMKRRVGCARSIHAADSMSLDEFKDYLGLIGYSWRLGYLEFDGFHFYWTPLGKEQAETTAADFASV